MQHILVLRSNSYPDSPPPPFPKSCIHPCFTPLYYPPMVSAYHYPCTMTRTHEPATTVDGTSLYSDPTNEPCTLNLKSTRSRASLNNHNALNCMFWNIQGLSDKLDYEHTQKEFSKFDIIMICETWVGKSRDTKDITLNGYQTMNFPRPTKHRKARRDSGGLLVFIRDSYVKDVVVTESLQGLCQKILLCAKSRISVLFYARF